MDTTTKRKSLHFCETVLALCSFVEQEYGFRCVETSVTRVRYESDKFFLNVYHGRLSYEIDAELGLIGVTQIYSFSELLAARPPRHYEKPVLLPYQTSSPKLIVEGVRLVADVIRTCFRDILLGDDVAFRKWADQVHMIRKEYTQQAVDGPSRKRMEEAWTKKDFHALLDASKTIGGKLSEIEQRRVDYARSHLIK